MSILLTGGEGFIGSHTAVELLNAGYDVIIADNYYNSSLGTVARIEEIIRKKVMFYDVDITDKTVLTTVFDEHNIDCVIYYAG